MKTVFDKSDYAAIKERIMSLQPTSRAQWGKMDAAQMLHHCCHTTEMALGEIKLKSNFFMRLIGSMVRKSFLSEKPFGKSAPTAPEFRVTSKKDFEAGKIRLLELLQQLHEGGEAGASKEPHGFFGQMTPKQWGETQWKHFDHHLRQFNV